MSATSIEQRHDGLDRVLALGRSSSVAAELSGSPAAASRDRIQLRIDLRHHAGRQLPLP
jgi:hypothetical protein